MCKPARLHSISSDLHHESLSIHCHLPPEPNPEDSGGEGYLSRMQHAALNSPGQLPSRLSLCYMALRSLAGTCEILGTAFHDVHPLVDLRISL